MRRAMSLFVVGVCATILVGRPAFAQSPADVTLTRIDCGTAATGLDGLRVVEVTLAMIESARTRRSVKIERVEP